MRVEILDLGINNIYSVANAFAKILNESLDIQIIDDFKKSQSPDLMVLPGLGHFRAGMQQIRDRKFDLLIEASLAQGVHLAGICLGMQLLAEMSEEAPGEAGLCLIKGEVKKLPAFGQIPHVGWEGTVLAKRSNTFQSLDSKHDFYFVHSYHLNPVQDKDTLIRTKFGNHEFVSGVIRGNVLGVQFHPEKSGRAGAQFLSEIISWSRGKSD